MRGRFPTVRTAVLVIASLVVAANPHWLRAESSAVLTEAVLSGEAVNQVTSTLDRSTKRARLVGLNVTALPDPGLRSQFIRQPALSFELFPDVYIVAVFDRFDPNTSGVTWVGHVENVPGSSVTLVYSGGLLAGNFIMRSGVFQIRPATEDVRAANRQATGEVHVVSEVDQAAMPPEAEPLIPVASPAAMATTDVRPLADTASTIDVMVVYTQLAQNAAGGATGIVNLINMGVSDTNTTYFNSDVKQRLRLVHTALVPHGESSSFGSSLSALRAGIGGLSGVPALRNLFRADLVMLLIHPTNPDVCGIGFLMLDVNTEFESSGYSVTDTNCVANLTMAHEWGHNMGASHDWFVSQQTKPTPYAHGYANWRPGQRWRTVMSYNDICIRQGGSCTRLAAWANPDGLLPPFCAATNFQCRPNLWYVPGQPGTGVRAGTKADCQDGVVPTTDCDADDHRTLNDTALTVANFRQSATSTASGRR
jgi:hypothetical protein